MKENLAKLFYDMAKIIFGAGIVAPLVQEKFDLVILVMSMSFVFVFTMVGVIVDLSGGEK